MILKVKDENGQFKEVILKGLKGDKGDKGDPGDQEEINKIKESLEHIKNEEIANKLHLFNPMDYIGTSEKSTHAKHFRIRVGGKDADTSTTISMALALKLQKYNCGTVDYAIVWDQPHCDADYPDEICYWIHSICE